MKLALFDVDGTLVDSQALIVGAATDALTEIGHPVPSRTEILSIVGLTLDLAIGTLAPELTRDQVDEAVAAYRAAYTRRREADPDCVPLFPGAAAALDALAARDDVLLGIATGKNRRGLDHILETHGWMGRFVTLQTADLHPSKPHPAMVLAALSETGVEAADAVMIGDTTFDMRMGRSAGVATLAVAWGYHPAAQIGPLADTLVEGFGEVPPALDRLWAGARRAADGAAGAPA